jgi:hypothetical protein
MALQKVKKVKGEKVDKPGRFGFDHWNTDARKNLDDEFAKMFAEVVKRIIGKTVDEIITECLDIATNEYECDAFLDRQDVNAVVVELPLGESDEAGPQWKFSFIDLIKNEIELFEEGYGGPIGDPKDRARLRALSDHLGVLLDLIDKALSRKVKA